MVLDLDSEAIRNAKMLKKFFEVPPVCSDPKAFMKKRRVLAQEIYKETLSLFEVQPTDAWPPRYDPMTHFRTSLDIERFGGPDGVWYRASGIRDDLKSPKNVIRIYF